MNHSRTRTSPRTTVKVTDGDRLGMTFFLAAFLHGILILGITFSMSPSAEENPPALDIILVQTSNQSESEDARFLAQVSQQGGGDSEKDVRPQDLFTAPSLSKDPGMALQNSQQQTARKVSVEQQQLLLASASDIKILSDDTVQQFDDETTPDSEQSNDATEVARLAHEINTKIEVGSSKEKVKYLNSSTKEFLPARYMREWINRVERIGNLNYPDRARRQKLSGTLVLNVTINADGKLVKTDLRRSSGHKVLDDAASRIVRDAAPYPPFPEKLRKEADVIHITRSWEFLSTNRLQTR